MNDSRKTPFRRKGVGCPWELAIVHLAERFKLWPGDLRRLPADEVRKVIALLGIEHEAREAMDGVPPDEEFIREG